MFGDSKNQKDNTHDLQSSLKDISNFDETNQSSSPLTLYTKTTKYRKTNKLMTALYMVTDIMEKDEPMRLKLRTLAVDILSDVTLSNDVTGESFRSKLEAMMSFLSISADMDMISEMNANILLQEFTELRKATVELHTEQHAWLGEYMKKPLMEEMPSRGYLSQMSAMSNKGYYQGHATYKGHPVPKDTNLDKGQSGKIGVQKGSTLLSALQDLEQKDNQYSSGQSRASNSTRHREILDIIKDNQKDNEGLTITDIKGKAKGLLSRLGQKTLQREISTMVESGILLKTGKKRWSKYSLI